MEQRAVQRARLWRYFVDPEETKLRSVLSPTFETAMVCGEGATVRAQGFMYPKPLLSVRSKGKRGLQQPWGCCLCTALAIFVITEADVFSLFFSS